MNLRATATTIETMLLRAGLDVDKMSVYNYESKIIAHFKDGSILGIDIAKMLSDAVQKSVDEIIKAKKPVAKPTKIADKSDK